MITFSFFKNKSLKNTKNEVIWDIIWVLFSINKQQVDGFIYKKKFIIYDYFLVENIKKINENEIIIDNESVNDISSNYELIWKNVVNQNWKNLWTIEDIEFDIWFKLKSIIIDEWYNLSSIEVINKKQISIKKNIRKISKKYIISFEKDKVIINDTILIENNKKTLENFYKIFINVGNTSYNFNKK